MGVLYLPRRIVDFCGFHVGKYTSTVDGIENEKHSEQRVYTCQVAPSFIRKGLSSSHQFQFC